MRRSAAVLKPLAAAAILACSLSTSRGVSAAQPPQLAGLPADRAALGSAFTEAWLSLRRDLDTLSRAGVHPALFEAWFAAMPRPVLRDAARIASDQQVVLAAAARLSDGARDEDRRLLGELERRYGDPPTGASLRALGVVAGDREALRTAEVSLESHEPFVALDGAVVLAAAHDSRGLSDLRRAVERRDGVSSWAARALGRYGEQADAALLEAAGSHGVDPNAVAVGLGEIAVRRAFPLHAAMLARRDPSGRRFDAVGGLYDTWLTVIGEAVAGGARDLTGLLAHVDRRRAQAVGEDGEVLRRELQSLIDFWTEVEACIRATAPAISWPMKFDEARRWLEARGGKEANPEQFARRVAAAIAILSNASGRLEYDHLSTPSPRVALLDADSGRSIDENFATSWRGAAGAGLEMEIDPGAHVDRIWIASGCDGSPGASLRAVRVSGRAKDGPWSISHRFTRASGYFEEIPLGAKRTGRISIEVVEVEGKVACVSELRAE
jgi:hypothetical protein